MTAWGSGTSVPTLLFWGGKEQGRELGSPWEILRAPTLPAYITHFQVHNTQSHGDIAGDITGPGGNTTHQGTTCPTVPRQALQRAGACWKAEGSLCCQGNSPRGSCQILAPLPRQRGLKLPWPGTTGLAAPVWGASPETSIPDSTSSPSARLQKSWPPSALSNPSCPVDTVALAPGSPLGTKQPRPPSSSHCQGGLSVGPSRIHLPVAASPKTLRRAAAFAQRRGQDCSPPSPANLQGTLG